MVGGGEERGGEKAGCAARIDLYSPNRLFLEKNEVGGEKGGKGEKGKAMQEMIDCRC